MPRRLAAALALAVASAGAVVAGVAAPAAAQVPGLTATLSVPSSTSVGVSVQATAVFTPPAGSTTPVQVGIRLLGSTTTATLATGTNSSELTGCIVRRANSSEVRCDWTPAGGGPQTLTVTINPLAVTIFAVAATSALPGSQQTAIAGASANFAITQQVPTTTTTTTTTAPSTPTSATAAPTSAAAAPTSAAAPTQAGSLPATGGSDANVFIALVVLALGAFLLIVARKFRET